VNAYFRGIGAVNADTGTKVWTIPFGKGSKLGAVQSVFNEGHLFLGGALMQKLQPDGTFKTLWESPARQPEYNVSYSHTVIKDGRLITFTPPALKCLDAETGKLINSVPCGGQGSVIMADGMAILFDNRPKVALITVGKDGLTEVSSFKPPIGGGRNDNFCHPAVAEGRLILRKFERVVVYDLRAGK
jgi:outer membrane protein assembly factor BamB